MGYSEFVKCSLGLLKYIDSIWGAVISQALYPPFTVVFWAPFKEQENINELIDSFLKVKGSIVD